MPNCHYIYALQDPRTKAVKYVGMTNNPTRRYAAHMRRPANKLVKKWLDDLRSEGIEPEMIILDQARKGRAVEIEKNMIWLFAVMAGNQILNGGARHIFHTHTSTGGMRTEAPYLECECGALFALEDSPERDQLYKLTNPVPGCPDILVCGACGEAVKPKKITRHISWRDWWNS